MVRKGRLELPRVTPLVPKTSASTSSATFAQQNPVGLLVWYQTPGNLARSPQGAHSNTVGRERIEFPRMPA